MNTSIKSILKIVLPLLLGGILVWYSLQKAPIETITSYFKNANYFWIGLGVFLGILSHISRAYRWKFMIEPLGYTLRFPNSLMAVFSAYLINYTVPRAGEVSRATLITNYEGVPFEKGFGTIVAERVADIFMMLVIIIITFFLEFDVIYNLFFEDIHIQKQLWLLVFFLVGIFTIYMIFKKGKHPFLGQLKTLVKGFLEGLLSIVKMQNKWAFIAHTFFIWIMYVLMFYVTSFSIDGIANLPFSALLMGFIAASFSIAATNGGIGSYPLAIYAAFSLFNIAEAPSLAFGWIMWTSQTIMIVVLGGLSLILLPFFNTYNPKQKAKQTSV
ncbi:flippase-like domain-containing protein [Flavobacteriaceae bacterium]|nr:flippase-like domain-containing protein [Flavobacteriaceae bacterium]